MVSCSMETESSLSEFKEDLQELSSYFYTNDIFQF